MYSRSKLLLSLIVLILVTLVLAETFIFHSASAQGPSINASFPGSTTSPTIKSQMWINDGTWWGAFSDSSSGIYFYKKVGNNFEKGILIDSNVLGMPDTLWDGSNLFVLVLEDTLQAKLYKYSYSTPDYILEPGFPVTLPLTGLAVSTVIAKDSTGKLWITYPGSESGAGGDSSIHAIWSTSADHLTWDTTGIVLETGTASNTTEVSSIIAFNDGVPKVGVFWSNQTLGQYGFRFHVDGDPETSWSPKEAVDSAANIASDYGAVQAAPDGRVLAVGLDQIGNGHLNFYVRSTAGVWAPRVPVNNDAASNPSRPLLLVDTDNNAAFCLYRDSAYNKSTFYARTSLSNPTSFQAPGILIAEQATDGTSTKQYLTNTTDLIAAASQDGEIYWNVLDLSAPPVASFQAVPGSGNAPLVVTFTDTSTDDSGIVSWNWNFGDGYTSILASPTHVFRGGSWNVSLQITDTSGNTATANQTINATDVGDPVIQAITPSVVNFSAVTGDITLTVDGANFVSGAVVRFDGSDRVTTFVSNTKLTATLLVADLSAIGDFPVTVALPSLAVSNPMTLTVSGENPVPTITTISPTTTTSTSPPFDLTVNGSGFIPTSKIWVNGTERTTVFISSTQLTTNISAADLAVPMYQIPVFVVNAAPGGGASSTLYFDITPTCAAPPAPITFAGDFQYNAVHSTLWYNDGSWWGALSDGSAGVYFWRRVGAQFVKGAQISANATAAPDTLWNGTDLFVLSYENSSSASFYKYSYDNVAKTYTLLPGFPVSIPLTGLASSLTFNQDSTGKLWATYTGTNNNDGVGDGKVHLIWTTTPDHLSWDTTGTILESGLSVLLTETSAITNFGGNKIGVSWTNQATNEVAFRYHLDGDLETSWSPKEVVDSGPLSASEYNNLKGLPDGRVFMAQIDNVGNRHLHLFKREVTGLWGPRMPVTQNAAAKPKTVVIAFDEVNGQIYVHYRDSGNGSNLYGTHMSVDANAIAAGCPVVAASVSNPTSTKQSVSGVTDLAIAVSGSTENLAIVNIGASGPPTISSLSPEIKTAGDPDFVLTVNGSNFAPDSAVTISGVARPTTFVSGGQLTAQITAADIAVGGVSPVMVVTPGLENSNIVNISVDNPPPILTSISPTTLPAGGGAFELTAIGTSFNPGTSIRFNGVDHVATFISTTEVRAQIAASEIATAGVFVVEAVNPTPGGGISFPQNFTAVITTPTLTSLNPTSAFAGGSSFNLTVSGTNFNANSTVLWNNTDRVTTFVSSTQLTAQITAADIQSASTATVAVVNAGAGTSSSLDFNITNPVPVISDLSPASVSAAGPSFTLTINGTGFVSGAVVRYNGNVPANDRPTVFVSSTQLTAQIAAADIASTGSAPVTVFNPLPGGGLSNAVNLVINNPVPTVTSLSPTNVTAGSSSFTLTVTGTNFLNGSTLRVNGTDAVTTFISSTQLSTNIPASLVTTQGSLSIAAFNPAPGGGLSNSIQFTINGPPPVVTSIAPNVKTAGETDFPLTVNGSGFNPTTVVRFNGADLPTTFVSASQVTAQIIAGQISSAGVFAITAFNPSPGGGASNSVDLTVNNQLPSVSSLSPSTALQGSAGFVLTVNGAGFVSNSVVTWDGQTRTTSFVDSTQLTAQITADDLITPSVIPLTVINPAPGGGPSNPIGFVVTGNPRLLTALNASGSSGGSGSVTIQLTAQGDENALGFSLNFDPALLSNPTASLGADAQAATLNVNTTQVAQGHFGVVLSLPAASTFSAGATNVVVVNFTVAAAASGTQTQLTFGDAPIQREVANTSAEVLPTAFIPGMLSITTGYEGDVAPRPNGNGNGTITVSDWVQVGRFAAGVDSTSSSSEYQRADCAPRSSLGNASITVSDWVQAGRYAAGLDSVLSAGGPQAPSTGAPIAMGSEDSLKSEMDESIAKSSGVVRMTGALERSGLERTINIELDGTGTENGFGFSLMFDPQLLQFVAADLGSDAQNGVLQINQASVAKGRLGIALALPTGQSFSARTNQVVVLRFKLLRANGERLTMSFTDLPIARELVSIDAGELRSNFVGLRALEVNPIEDAQYFVYQQYLDILGRQPDVGGLEYWTRQITECGEDQNCIQRRRVAVSDAFFVEREFQETGSFVSRIYKAAFGVQPTFEQFKRDRLRLLSQPGLEQGKTEFIDSLMRQSPFRQIYSATMPAADYVDALNANANNSLSPAERLNLIEGLESKRETQETVLRKVVDSSSFTASEYNRSFVMMQYFGYLRRDPEPEGFNFWLQQINRYPPGNTEAQHALVCSFITSAEYQMRFGSTLNRSNADCAR